MCRYLWLRRGQTDPSKISAFFRRGPINEPISLTNSNVGIRQALLDRRKVLCDENEQLKGGQNGQNPEMFKALIPTEGVELKITNRGNRDMLRNLYSRHGLNDAYMRVVKQVLKEKDDEAGLLSKTVQLDDLIESINSVFEGKGLDRVEFEDLVPNGERNIDIENQSDVNLVKTLYPESHHGYIDEVIDIVIIREVPIRNLNHLLDILDHKINDEPAQKMLTDRYWQNCDRDEIPSGHLTIYRSMSMEEYWSFIGNNPAHPNYSELGGRADNGAHKIGHAGDFIQASAYHSYTERHPANVIVAFKIKNEDIKTLFNPEKIALPFNGYTPLTHIGTGDDRFQHSTRGEGGSPGRSGLIGVKKEKMGDFSFSLQAKSSDAFASLVDSYSIVESRGRR